MNNVDIRRLSAADFQRLVSEVEKNFWLSICLSLGEPPGEVTIEEMLRAMPEFVRQLNEFSDDIKISLGGSILNLEE